MLRVNSFHARTHATEYTFLFNTANVIVFEMKKPGGRDTFLWQGNVSYAFEFGGVGAGNSLKIKIPPVILENINGSRVDNDNVTVYLECHQVDVSDPEELKNAPQLIARVEKIVEGIYVDKMLLC